MSWKVEWLLKNQEIIRCNLLREDGYVFNEPLGVYDFENETYQDLLILEAKIEELKAKGGITEEEYNFINLIKNSTPPRKMVKLTNTDIRTIYKTFSTACERIAFTLGGSFTDEGLLFKMIREKGLTEEQVLRLRQYFSKSTVEKMI